MVMNKRGQLFLLAAVIISVVVLSLGVTTNRAVISSEPEEFYELSYEVKRESSASLDFEIYTGITGPSSELEDFVESLANEVKDKEPDANFVIIYGNNIDGVTVISKGIGGNKNTITLLDSTLNFNSMNDIEIESVDAESLEDGEFEIEFGDQNSTFLVTEYNQIIFIIQKDVEDEVFIAVQQ